MDNDLDVVFKLESEISEEIRKDNGCTVNFNYHAKPGGCTVKVFTYNPKTKEFFLLMSTTAMTSAQALESILQYVQTHKNEMNSYTVTWTHKNKMEQNTSYFYCKDALEVLEKFFDGKDRQMYSISELKLNPIS